MKILHVETGRHLYGGALQVFYLIRGLRERDVASVLVCARGSAIGAACRPFAEVVEIDMAGDVDPRFFSGLCRTVRQLRPDVLHAHSRRGADWWTGLAARRFGLPAVVTRRVDNREAPWLARLKYGMYDRVASISEGIRQVLIDEGVAAGRIPLIHSAVDSDKYQQSRDRVWFEREFSLPAGSRVLAVIAQMIERKGHRYLIDGLPTILAEHPATRVIFFGQGPLRQELETLCTSRGLSHVVHFAGFRDDLDRVLPNLDLVVHPALMEGLGVSLLQASAAGVPIVAARAGGIPEVVRDGVNGALVEPGTVEPLAAAIRRYLADESLARDHGAAGRELVRNEFSISAMVDSYHELYGGLLQPTPIVTR